LRDVGVFHEIRARGVTSSDVEEIRAVIDYREGRGADGTRIRRFIQERAPSAGGEKQPSRCIGRTSKIARRVVRCELNGEKLERQGGAKVRSEVLARGEDTGASN
jgi:hypothetical protein